MIIELSPFNPSERHPETFRPLTVPVITISLTTHCSQLQLRNVRESKADAELMSNPMFPVKVHVLYVYCPPPVNVLYLTDLSVIS